METLLRIPKPKRNSFILWEHLLKSAVAFIGTFALLFFGPMMLGSRRRSPNPEDTLAYKIMDYILHHPEVHMGLSVLAVIVLNVYLVFKNRKIRYVVNIEADADNIRLEKTNLYYSRTQQVEIPKVDFELHIEKSVTEDNEKRQKIVFRNAREKKIAGEIDPAHSFWSDHVVQLKDALRALREYRKPDLKTADRRPGISRLFKR